MGNFICPHCTKDIPASEINQWVSRRAGKATSEKKAASSVENGKKGGRPKLPRKEGCPKSKAIV